MTWRTSLGNRVLEGIEAAFYLTAMQHAADYLEDAYEFEDDIVQTYDRMFDLASFDQKIILLHTCLSALLDSNIAALELSNLIEAAAYFPFAFLRLRVNEEIEQGDWLEEDDPNNLRYFYRHLVWIPFEEYILPTWQTSDADEEVNEAEAAFNPRSDDFELWNDALDGLIDRIFWDRDWMMTWTNPQVLDGVEESISQPLGLDDYFTNRLPKISAEESELSLIQHSRLALAEIRNWKLDGSHKK